MTVSYIVNWGEGSYLWMSDMMDAGTELTRPSTLVTTIPTMYDSNLSSPILFAVVDGYETRLCASDLVVALLGLCKLECFPIEIHVVMVVVVDRLLLLMDLHMHDAILSLLDTVGQSQC